MTRARTGLPADPAGFGHTGRQLVLLKEGTGRAGAEILRNATGLRMGVSSDFDGSVRQTHLAPGEGMLFERLGAALLHGDPDQARALANRTDGEMLLVEPERYVRASGLADGPTATTLPLADTTLATWGLQATRILSSRYAGRGIRVAILDTGVDLQHPDFAGRMIVSQSFVTGLPVDDGNGHGTFCVGVACGPQQPSQPPRYGIAFGADLYIARVLDDNAGGTDGNILAGIDWAVRNNCAVISMSLGSPVAVGDSYPYVYEQVAARALAAGSLLIAPAGNESQRPDTIAPVEHPANCPSIVAIGALDPSFAVAPFSNGGLNSNGGEVNLAAPGIAIFSAAPRPTLYQTASGTSMAAPYAAGIAALLAEANPTARGAALQALLLQSFVALVAPARDVGAGLVQAPQ
jgi:subtilisin family serine protease